MIIYLYLIVEVTSRGVLIALDLFVLYLELVKHCNARTTDNLIDFKFSFVTF